MRDQFHDNMSSLSEEDRKYIAFYTKEFDRITNKVEQIKRDKPTEGYTMIKNLLKAVHPETLESYPLPKDTIIYRARIHKEGDPKEFKTEEISYRRDIENIKTFGRCNEVSESMFYGNTDMSHTLTEVLYHELKDNGEQDREIDVTIGEWEVKEDIPVVPVCVALAYTEKFFESVNPNDLYYKIIKSILKEWEAPLKRKLFFCYSYVMIYYYNHFTTYEHKEPNTYKITTAFTSIAKTFLNKEGKQVQGVVYPSIDVRTQKDLNIAITPISVHNCLDHVNTYKCKINVSKGAVKFINIIKNDDYNKFIEREVIFYKEIADKKIVEKRIEEMKQYKKELQGNKKRVRIAEIFYSINLTIEQDILRNWDNYPEPVKD